MTVHVELYGRLREAGLDTPVELALPDGATAAQAMDELKRLLGARAGLLDGAALASESEVLEPSAALPSGGRLAALPPVCGG